MPSKCSECGSPFPSTATDGSDSIIDVLVAPGTLARHQELLCTNAAPEGPELIYIRAVVSKTGARLAGVEAEISRLRQLLQQLEDERTSLSRYHAPNKAILSPLRRMPPEVLSEIFLWTMPSFDARMNRRKFNVEDSPWVLTHVSSRWRAISLSTPSLWSQIVINCSHLRSNPLNMVKTQIERAQKLSIHFQANGSQPPRPQIDMFRLLAEHSLRWQELNIELTSHIFPLLSTLRNRVPFLHTIWIQWADAASQEGVASVDCFQTAPSLLDVGIANIFRHVLVPLPAHQLTRYVLDAPWTVHEGILKSALNLVEARISVVFSQDWPNSSTAVNLPSLRRLYVAQSRILDYIRTPALEELGILTRRDYGRRVLPHFESFLVHSSCSLRRLCLRGFPDTHTVTEILRKAPTVIDLTIITKGPDPGGITNTLISNLTIRGLVGSTPVAPHLRGLFFGYEDGSYIDYALYLKMLQSRWKAADRVLEAAALLTNTGPGPDTTTTSGLHVLRQEGLDLTLLQGTEARRVISRWNLWTANF